MSKIITQARLKELLTYNEKKESFIGKYHLQII